MRCLLESALVVAVVAANMMVVYGSFVIGDERMKKNIGPRLTVADLVDATVVRVAPKLNVKVRRAPSRSGLRTARIECRTGRFK